MNPILTLVLSPTLSHPDVFAPHRTTPFAPLAVGHQRPQHRSPSHPSSQASPTCVDLPVKNPFYDPQYVAGAGRGGPPSRRGGGYSAPRVVVKHRSTDPATVGGGNPPCAHGPPPHFSPIPHPRRALGRALDTTPPNVGVALAAWRRCDARWTSSTDTPGGPPSAPPPPHPRHRAVRLDPDPRPRQCCRAACLPPSGCLSVAPPGSHTSACGRRPRGMEGRGSAFQQGSSIAVRSPATHPHRPSNQ